MKPNDNPVYIDKRSNHPPHIFKNLPAGICNRISTNSSSEEIFKKAEGPYIDALKLGHQQKVGIQVGRSEKVGFYKGTFRAQTRYDRTFSQFFGTF